MRQAADAGPIEQQFQMLNFPQATFKKMYLAGGLNKTNHQEYQRRGVKPFNQEYVRDIPGTE